MTATDPVLAPAFPPDVRPAARRFFFGTETAPRRAIVTPIPTLFAALPPSRTLPGVWPCLLIDETLAVLVPQANAAMDAVCCLEPGAEILFAGLAGSVGALRPGDVVTPRAAVLGDRLIQRSSSSDPGFPEAIVAHVTCLADSFTGWRRHTGRADCVDMETALLYGACQDQGKLCTSILIISDALPDHPFFAVPPGAWRDRVPEVATELLRLCVEPQGPDGTPAGR